MLQYQSIIKHYHIHSLVDYRRTQQWKNMVQNIEFRNVKSSFQDQLQNDVKRIKQDPMLLIPADKPNNLHRLTTDEYNKLLTENISKSYKKN